MNAKVGWNSQKPRHVMSWLPVLVVMFVCSHHSSAQAASAVASSTVPPQRLANLRHGINASEWFAQVYDPKGYTKEHFQAWTTAQDIALLKAMGGGPCLKMLFGVTLRVID